MEGIQCSYQAGKNVKNDVEDVHSYQFYWYLEMTQKCIDDFYSLKIPQQAFGVFFFNNNIFLMCKICVHEEPIIYKSLVTALVASATPSSQRSSSLHLFVLHRLQ
jgi:hypothetical protein